jgi:hypothetical protein
MTYNLTQNILQLSRPEQQRLFRILTDNADILNKIIPNVVLLEYISTGNTSGITNDPVIQAYNIWKAQN